MTAVFKDRARGHEAPHIRHIDVQVLDALLRIEELMTKQNTLLVDLGTGKLVEPAVVKPAPTAKRNPRQL